MGEDRLHGTVRAAPSLASATSSDAHHFAANGCPVLDDALAYVACEVESSTPAGDSTVYIARVVEAVALKDGEPLTMREAGFRHAG